MAWRRPLYSVLCLVVCLVAVFGSGRAMGMPPGQAAPAGSWYRAPVTLVDNGYRGLVLAIADNVPKNPQLLEEIKAVFTNASAFLYQATGNRSYFHELTILVPQSWPEVRPFEYQPASGESFAAANIVVKSAADRDTPSQPFVKQPGMCGEEGVYMHLTDEAIETGNDGPWGNLARALVHEWGHLRWGLFDEYPTGPDAQHFYLTSTGAVEATRCSKAVTGDALPYLPPGRARAPGAGGKSTVDVRCDVVGNAGRLPHPSCRFRPHAGDEQAQVARGSLMYTHNVDQVTEFCHSDPSGDPASRHNPEAPNRHNKLCNGRSAWDVMLNSADFAMGANPPREGANTRPQFTVKRKMDIRIVLVLDASSSMNDNGKFDKLMRTSSFYLGEFLWKDMMVGLVQFNETASVLAPLTKIRYRSSRQRLMDKLPVTAGGNSSIGAGVMKALELLSANGKSPAGGAIFVMSDGLEDTPPLFSDVADDVRSRGVNLDAWAYSFELEDNFLIPDSEGGFSISIPFSENDTMEMNDEDEEFRDVERFLTIARRTKRLPGHANSTGRVHMDSTVGNETIFRFIWESGNVTATVRRPDGSAVDLSRAEYSLQEGTAGRRQVEIRIQGVAQTGTWRYEIRNENENAQSVRIHVYSRPSEAARPPLQAKVTIKRNQFNFTEERRLILYGEVTQGELPVIRAKVIALVKRPGDVDSSDIVAVELFDRGLGADTTEDDGVYSAYFIGFAGAGTYKVTLEVENEAVGQAKKITFPQSPSGLMPSNWNNTRERVLVDLDPFMRATQAVEFTVVAAPTTDEMNAVDMFPPARVTDLRVAGVSTVQGSLTLRWTAPGDDYDIGKAAVYDLRYGHSFDEISNFRNATRIGDSDVTIGDLSTPRQGGSEETITVRIPTLLSAEPSLMLFRAFRLRAVDDAGLAGETSNIATVVIDYSVTPPPSSSPVLSTVATEATTPMGCGTTATPDNHWEYLGKNVAIVLGVAVLLVLFSVVVLCVACRRGRRPKGKKTKVQEVFFSTSKPTRKVSDAWVLEEA